MKTLWPFGLSLFATTLAASAQTGFYTTVDVGGTFTDNASFRGTVGLGRDGLNTPLNVVGTVRFDPGLRLGISGGYRITDWLGVEVVSGIMSSEIESIYGYGAGGLQMNTPVQNAYLSGIPVMAGVRLEWPRWRVSPYVGASVGGAISVLEANHVYVGGAGDGHGVQSDIVFAWQAFGGVRYAINHHMSLGVEYHILSTQATEWHDGNPLGGPYDRFRIGGVLVNSVSAAFEYKF